MFRLKTLPLIALFLGLSSPALVRASPICDLIGAGEQYNLALAGKTKQARLDFFAALQKEVSNPETLAAAQAELSELDRALDPTQKRVWFGVVRKLLSKSETLQAVQTRGLSQLTANDLTWLAQHPKATRALQRLLKVRDTGRALAFYLSVAMQLFKTHGEVSHAARIQNRYLRTLGSLGMGLVQMLNHVSPLAFPDPWLYTHREYFKQLEERPDLEPTPEKKSEFEKTPGASAEERSRKTYLKLVPKVVPMTMRGIAGAFRALRWTILVSTVVLAQMETSVGELAVSTERFLSDEYMPDSSSIQILSQGLPNPTMSIRIEGDVYSFLPNQMHAVSAYQYAMGVGAVSVSPVHGLEIRIGKDRVSELKKRLSLMSMREYPERYEVIGRSGFVAELLEDYGVATPNSVVARSPQLSSQWYAFSAQWNHTANRVFRLDPTPEKTWVGVAWDDLLLNRVFLKTVIFQIADDAFVRHDWETPVDRGPVSPVASEVFSEWREEVIQDTKEGLELGLFESKWEQAGDDPVLREAARAELRAKIDELKYLPLADLQDDRKSLSLWVKAWYQVTYLMEVESEYFGVPSADLIEAEKSFSYPGLANPPTKR